MIEPNKSDYQIVENPLGYARPICVITTGAGASGLNVARNIKKHLKSVSLQVYEKNASIGGTWFANRYPRCACDIPSHNYQYSWEPNPNWTSYYPPQPEILEYFECAAEKHDLMQFIKLWHEVVEVVWEESSGVWVFKIENLATGETIKDYGYFFHQRLWLFKQLEMADHPKALFVRRAIAAQRRKET